MIDFKFYLVTDRNVCAPRSLQSVVREACDAGVRAVQLREKDLSEKEFEAWTTRLRDITKKRNAKLLLNRARPMDKTADVFVAASLGVDGFHFPQAVPFPHELRTRFPKLLVGVSAHSVEQAVAAAAQGADFVTFGPVYETASKAKFGPPLGIEALSNVTAAARIPVLAIGGVTPDNAAECLGAGAFGVAAIGAVLTAANVTDVINRFAAALGSL